MFYQTNQQMTLLKNYLWQRRGGCIVTPWVNQYVFILFVTVYFCRPPEIIPNLRIQKGLSFCHYSCVITTSGQYTKKMGAETFPLKKYFAGELQQVSEVSTDIKPFFLSL